MNTAPLPPTIKGWCPSVIRPMETGDGLLVRLHLSGGELSADTCAAIGRLALTYGNGLIDLTQRGNLQLRGISAETLPALTIALDELGLLDRDGPRNVIGSPLSGIDHTALIDGRALLCELEARLAAAPDLLDLPEKFSFLIDDGGCLGLDGVNADIRLIGVQSGVAVALNGGEGGSIAIALADVSKAADTAIAVARAFMRLSEGADAKRMDQLVQAQGAVEIARAAGLPKNVFLPSVPVRSAGASDVIGAHDGFIGVAAPFGRLDAAQMRLLASLAKDGLRLTPWRALLLANADASTLEVLEDAGLIISLHDARLKIAACSGQPACNAAQIDTHYAANELAKNAGEWAVDGIAIHISGCSKGCAYGASAPTTLVGRDGAYDLVYNGRADTTPHLRGLDFSQAITAISAAHAGKIAS